MKRSRKPASEKRGKPVSAPLTPEIYDRLMALADRDRQRLGGEARELIEWAIPFAEAAGSLVELQRWNASDPEFRHEVKRRDAREILRTVR